MNKEKLFELERILDESSKKMLELFDESPLGLILDKLHLKFYEEFREAITTALSIENKYHANKHSNTKNN